MILYQSQIEKINVLDLMKLCSSLLEMILFKYQALKNSVLYCCLLRGVQTIATLSKCCQQHLCHDRLQTIRLQGKIKYLDCFIYVHVILLFGISYRNRWLAF